MWRTTAVAPGLTISWMIAPVLVLSAGVLSVGIYGWLTLTFVILAGGRFIWWITERAWGKFS
jgi:hypothetical protein